MTAKSLLILLAYTTPALAAITATPGKGVSTPTSPINVTLSASPVATIYYTTDGSTPTTSSTVYSGTLTFNTTTMLRSLSSGTYANNSYNILYGFTPNSLPGNVSWLPYANTVGTPITQWNDSIAPTNFTVTGTGTNITRAAPPYTGTIFSGTGKYLARTLATIGQVPSTFFFVFPGGWNITWPQGQAFKGAYGTIGSTTYGEPTVTFEGTTYLFDNPEMFIRFGKALSITFDTKGDCDLFVSGTTQNSSAGGTLTFGTGGTYNANLRNWSTAGTMTFTVSDNATLAGWATASSGIFRINQGSTVVFGPHNTQDNPWNVSLPAGTYTLTKISGVNPSIGVYSVGATPAEAPSFTVTARIGTETAYTGIGIQSLPYKPTARTTSPASTLGQGAWTLTEFIAYNRALTTTEQQEVWDYIELNSKEDYDEDNIPNQEEYAIGSDPWLNDTNSDQIIDSIAQQLGVSLTITDTDGDSLPNTTEKIQGTQPLFPDSDGDTVNDDTDVYPLDPSRSVGPTPDPHDHTPPNITLLTPTNAIP